MQSENEYEILLKEYFATDQASLIAPIWDVSVVNHNGTEYDIVDAGYVVL